MPFKDEEEGRAYYQQWYAANREKKIAQVTEHVKRDPEKRRIWEKRRYERIRQEVFEHYGQECACCGETEPMFLTIDHINGGGAKHRAQIFGAKASGGGPFYIWLRRMGFPDGFQTLCINCNLGRARNGGICPHKKEL